MPLASEKNAHEELTTAILGDQFSRAEPARLFHYTSAAGLDGILSSKLLRCSHVAYTNDEMELRQLIAEFRTYLKPKIFANTANGEPLMSMVRQTLERWIVRDGPIFVACFSAADPNEDLSQWRAYAQRGYCLEFATPVSDHFGLATFDWQLGPCTYEPGHRIVQRILGHADEDRVLTALRELRDKTVVREQEKGVDAYAWGDKAGRKALSEKLEDILSPLRKPLSAVAPFCKSASFRAEGEWRLVLRRSAGAPQPVKLRVGRRTMIPFIEVNLRPTSPLPFKVWAGPDLDPELAVPALELLDLEARQVSFRLRSDI